MARLGRAYVALSPCTARCDARSSLRPPSPTNHLRRAEPVGIATQRHRRSSAASRDRAAIRRLRQRGTECPGGQATVRHRECRSHPRECADVRTPRGWRGIWPLPPRARPVDGRHPLRGIGDVRPPRAAPSTCRHPGERYRPCGTGSLRVRRLDRNLKRRASSARLRRSLRRQCDPRRGRHRLLLGAIRCDHALMGTAGSGRSGHLPRPKRTCRSKRPPLCGDFGACDSPDARLSRPGPVGNHLDEC